MIKYYIHRPFPHSSRGDSTQCAESGIRHLGKILKFSVLQTPWFHIEDHTSPLISWVLKEADPNLHHSLIFIQYPIMSYSLSNTRQTISSCLVESPPGTGKSTLIFVSDKSGLESPALSLTLYVLWGKLYNLFGPQFHMYKSVFMKNRNNDWGSQCWATKSQASYFYNKTEVRKV